MEEVYSISFGNKDIKIFGEGMEVYDFEELIMFEKGILSKEEKYSFEIEFEGNEYKEEESLVIEKDGSKVCIGVPYIEDKNGKQTDDCNFLITKDKNLHFEFEYKHESYGDEDYPIRVKFVIRKELEFNKTMKVKEEINGNEEIKAEYEDEHKSDIVYNFDSGEEILVRKKVAASLEKCLRYYGYTIAHDEYKKIVYRERLCADDNEFRIKNYYDAYVYILTDYKNSLTNERLRKYLYLVSGQESSKELVNKIVNSFFNLKELELVSFIASFYHEIKDDVIEYYKEEMGNVILLMLINYCLLSKNHPLIVIRSEEYKELNNMDDYHKFFGEVILRTKHQRSDYYKSLSTISIDEIKEAIREDEKNLKEKYMIEKIYVFGSFAKRIERIDSDIDLMVQFSLDASSILIDEAKEYIKNRYLEILHRNIDVVEMPQFLTDEVIIDIQSGERVM